MVDIHNSACVAHRCLQLQLRSLVQRRVHPLVLLAPDALHVACRCALILDARSQVVRAHPRQRQLAVAPPSASREGAVGHGRVVRAEQRGGHRRAGDVSAVEVDGVHGKGKGDAGDVGGEGTGDGQRHGRLLQPVVVRSYMYGNCCNTCVCTCPINVIVIVKCSAHRMVAVSVNTSLVGPTHVTMTTTEGDIHGRVALPSVMFGLGMSKRARPLTSLMTGALGAPLVVFSVIDSDIGVCCVSTHTAVKDGPGDGELSALHRGCDVAQHADLHGDRCRRV